MSCLTNDSADLVDSFTRELVHVLHGCPPDVAIIQEKSVMLRTLSLCEQEYLGVLLNTFVNMKCIYSILITILLILKQ